MTSLNRSALNRIDSDVQRPTYDLDAGDLSIVHFGVGGFHRAHMASYIDDLRNRGQVRWTLHGVGMLEADTRMRKVMRKQENLYTLRSFGPEGDVSTRIIGSISRYQYAPDDPAAILRLLTNPETRIVSLTITEGGYEVDDITGAFSPQSAATMTDLQSIGGPETLPPESALGYIVQGLARRRDAGTKPFTVMSCDNIQHNGDVARTAVLGFAAHVSTELADWIAVHVRFPNSMVDRITPATTDLDRTELLEDFELEDAWPVRTERFRQWVLEDSFSDGRPPLEDVGVQVVADVEPYEQMKLRLLNASHQLMSQIGILVGMVYVHEACEDEHLGPFIDGYMRHEAAPSLAPVPGVDLAEYRIELLRRFRSRTIADTLSRQVVDASERIPRFLLPVIRDRISGGGEIWRSALALAAWSLHLEDAMDHGKPIPDRQAEFLLEAVNAERRHPAGFLDAPWLFGELGQSSRLRNEFVQGRQRLLTFGARECARMGTDSAAQDLRREVRP